MDTVMVDGEVLLQDGQLTKTTRLLLRSSRTWVLCLRRSRTSPGTFDRFVSSLVDMGMNF